MLPQFQSKDRDFTLMQNSWAAQIQPVLDFPINSGIILKSVSLTAGTNTINHMLDRTLQGWFVVRQRDLASIYDAQDSNKIPNKTLVLVSTANVTIDLIVF
jgi:hypothetical protein